MMEASGTERAKNVASGPGQAAGIARWISA
jgi:hypothetical protein